nr:hypothetical protein [Shigella flexneri]
MFQLHTVEEIDVFCLCAQQRRKRGGAALLPVIAQTLDFISQFRLDFGILGISGIDSDGSLLEFDYHEVRTKRAIIENSRHVMLVVDHSKFGRNAMVNMGSISMVDAVYTDAPPPVSVMQVLTDHHIQLELC